MALILFFIILFLILVFLEKKNKYLSTGNKEHYFIIIMSIAAFLILFSDCIWNGWKLSYSNFIYFCAPFKSMQIPIKGPFLSDVIDDFLPSFFDKVVNLNFTDTWIDFNVFGYRKTFLEWLDPKKLVFLLGLETGQLFYLILKYVIAYLGMYLYLRKIKLSELASFVGSITFTFSSVMVVWGGWPHTDVTAYAPFLFYFAEVILEKYKEERGISVQPFIGFTIFLYLMFVTGMPTYVPFFLYTGIAYSLFRVLTLFDFKTEYKFVITFFAGLGISTLIAVLMSFVYTGDILTSTSHYQEIRRAQSFATLDIAYLRTLIAPYLRDGFSVHMNESTIFSGFVFMFILPAYLLIKNREKYDQLKKQIYFWSLFLLIITAFVFVPETGEIYKFIPLLNTSLKTRIIVLFNFSASIIAGICFECFTKMRQDINLKNSLIVYLIPLCLIWVVRKQLENQAVTIAAMTVLLIAACFQGILLSNKKLPSLLLCGIVVIQMTMFAREYMPLIPAEADVIPKPTSSIAYLQENSNNGERMTAIGTWTFFPNINLFYGLNDIRGHGFINTASDVKEYISQIDSTAYESNTRTELHKIENYNLLKWSSVKYLLSGEEINYLQMIDNLITEHGTARIPFAYYGDENIEQSFTAEQKFNCISLLLSTYEKQLSDTDYCYISIVDESDNEIATEEICLANVEDNQFYNIPLRQPASEGIYKLHISGNRRFENPLAFWKTDQDILGGTLTVSEQFEAGSLSLVIDSHVSDFTFDDGMNLEIIEDTSPRAYLADHIIVKNSDAEILDAMKSEYVKNTVFTTEKLSDKSAFSEGNSEILDVIREKGKITVKVNANEGTVLVLNDYFSDGWMVSIDGIPAECLKVNYLFRGVVIPKSGQQVVEFCYHDPLFFKCLIVSLIGFFLIVAVIFSRKLIEKQLLKIGV